MATVAVMGIGNIGTVLCDALAREPGIDRLIVIDPDTYKEENLRGQTISALDVGLPKAQAQASRLRAIRPTLQVEPIVDRLENVPPGRLFNCDVICSCLDSVASRAAVNRIVWKLGKPWVDAGVLSESLLARTEVFLPGSESPCFECALSPRQYEAIDQRHLCVTGAPAPTNAPAWLGAHAASLQAAECVRILRHLVDETHAVEPVQIIHDLGNRRQFVNRNQRSKNCRFDHRMLPQIEPTWEPLQELFSRGGVFDECATLAAYGRTFVLGGACFQCGYEFPGVQTIESGGLFALECQVCHQVTAVHPLHRRDRLEAREVPAPLLRYSPEVLGLPEGSLLTITYADTERHYLMERNTNGQYL